MGKSGKIDISSTAVEKTIDAAKSFLGKLIVPSVEEVDLLMKENITYWRFKNQVKILNKAHDYCQKSNITPTNSKTLDLVYVLLFQII